MISNEELIYNFTDVYLKTAMECSICKENYDMTDDREFLDEFVKFFLSLYNAKERDTALELESVKNTLENRKNKKNLEFQEFLKRKIADKALELVDRKNKNSGGISHDDNTSYIDKISELYQEVFDDGFENVKDHPMELLKYIRAKEEKLSQKRGKIC